MYYSRGVFICIKQLFRNKWNLKLRARGIVFLLFDQGVNVFLDLVELRSDSYECM